jgi:hypothetical protein
MGVTPPICLASSPSKFAIIIMFMATLIQVHVNLLVKKSKPNESACTEDLACRSCQTSTQQLGDHKESLREKDGNKSMREHWGSRQCP